MREILFRAKRVDNGEWVKGFLSKSRNIEEKPALLKPCIDYEENGVMMSSIVDPETVGQYTGLTDKNGNKIFEGDIVSAHGYLGYVSTDTDYWEIHWNNDFNRELYLWKDTAEVIGNIHDNPELLGENTKESKSDP